MTHEEELQAIINNPLSDIRQVEKAVTTLTRIRLNKQLERQRTITNRGENI